jgi:hypothetical protein
MNPVALGADETVRHVHQELARGSDLLLAGIQSAFQVTEILAVLGQGLLKVRQTLGSGQPGDVFSQVDQDRLGLVEIENPFGQAFRSTVDEQVLFVAPGLQDGVEEIVVALGEVQAVAHCGERPDIE